MSWLDRLRARLRSAGARDAPERPMAEEFRLDPEMQVSANESRRKPTSARCLHSGGGLFRQGAAEPSRPGSMISAVALASRSGAEGVAKASRLWQYWASDWV
jgi:hypothetical protein